MFFYWLKEFNHDIKEKYIKLFLRNCEKLLRFINRILLYKE